ncbi:hypothetical protein PUN28_009635 [Cardiocondyla obscurior]|uniref:Uncharacterized protein n=1 Tax=Cardiocondyla obscurior TaxID=286306 RepID=A0AAW2FVN9_9HYME
MCSMRLSNEYRDCSRDRTRCALSSITSQKAADMHLRSQKRQGVPDRDDYPPLKSARENARPSISNFSDRDRYREEKAPRASKLSREEPRLSRVYFMPRIVPLTSSYFEPRGFLTGRSRLGQAVVEALRRSGTPEARKPRAKAGEMLMPPPPPSSSPTPPPRRQACAASVHGETRGASSATRRSMQIRIRNRIGSRYSDVIYATAGKN